MSRVYPSSSSTPYFNPKEFKKEELERICPRYLKWIKRVTAFDFSKRKTVAKIERSMPASYRLENLQKTPKKSKSIFSRIRKGGVNLRVRCRTSADLWRRWIRGGIMYNTELSEKDEIEIEEQKSDTKIIVDQHIDSKPNVENESKTETTKETNEKIIEKTTETNSNKTETIDNKSVETEVKIEEKVLTETKAEEKSSDVKESEEKASNGNIVLGEKEKQGNNDEIKVPEDKPSVEMTTDDTIIDNNVEKIETKTEDKIEDKIEGQIEVKTEAKIEVKTDDTNPEKPETKIEDKIEDKITAETDAKSVKEEVIEEKIADNKGPEDINDENISVKKVSEDEIPVEKSELDVNNNNNIEIISSTAVEMPEVVVK
ncbi:unnamed protein product [Medioppia subpectinata]|uniref:Uncharacterized protein n=1 Tax=Medioppia subpectinata TaxID=1979941 RepID=A0A7R9PU97_9ACAR|nr:unnamed protein product [Medioppia subpectinata]CAG2101346.1 unnamed protein product [Medioppia subpectinata]